MIKTFRDRRTAAAFQGLRLKGCPPDVVRRAQKRLRQLHAARTLQDLRVPPSNRLEALEQERKGQHSIRINDQWRICFVWRDGDAYDVEMTDSIPSLMITRGRGSRSSAAARGRATSAATTEGDDP